MNDLARAVVGCLYPDQRGRMYQYLNVDRLRTFGGEGALAKVLLVEDLAMERAALKWAEWAAKKPSAAEMADFQEGVAAEAYDALKKEFAYILASYSSK